MKTELRITEDGSHTLYVPGLNEHYHSVHGAIQESEHVFIRAGLDHCTKNEIHVFEVGFGTGLNAMLAGIYSIKNKKRINYHSVELIVLGSDIYSQFNYKDCFPEYGKLIDQILECKWDTTNKLSNNFTLQKVEADILVFNDYKRYDVIFFDAFAPDVQPLLWTAEIFSKIYNSLNEKGILTTYSAKGAVKRALRNAGFEVTKLPGPPGKREMIRAEKK